MLRTCCLFLALLLLSGTPLAAAKKKAPDLKDHGYSVDVPMPPRKGKERPPTQAQLWLPEGELKGLLVAGKVLLEPKICNNPDVRAACTEAGLGILYFKHHAFATFPYAKSDCGERMLTLLDDLAAKAGKPAVAQVPWLTMGHSTGGIYCRNIAFWKPDRIIGIIHIKSGNFQDGVQDPEASIAGIPFLAINGEFEEYGPAGGDIKGGLRSAYSLHENKSKQNQSQWICIRQQIIDRRKRQPDNLMSLIVHKGGSHTNWNQELTALCCQFIKSSTAARVAGPPSGDGPVSCTTLTQADCWLSDADIKAPQHPSAPAGDYAGDKSLTFCHVDEAMAKAMDAYHQGPWAVADPTAGLSADERYVPEKLLQDPIDR